MAWTLAATKIAESRRGQVKVKDFNLDITESATAGGSLTAATLGFSYIKAFIVMGAETTNRVLEVVVPVTRAENYDSVTLIVRDAAGSAQNGADEGIFKVRVEGV